MLAKAFRQCQWNERLCYSRRPRRLGSSGSGRAHARLVSPQSFPHLWKNLWKIHWYRWWRSTSAWFYLPSKAGETADSRLDTALRRAYLLNRDKRAESAGRRPAEPSFAQEMNVWDQILARIETKVNRHSFYTWFKPTAFVAEDRASVTVRVPNAMFKDWLTKHYSGVIGEAMSELKKPGLAVNFVADAR